MQMDGDGIRVSWRVAVLPQGGSQPVYGRLHSISPQKMLVNADHNMPAGCRCDFAVMLPKVNSFEPESVLEGCGVVVLTVLSAAQFRIRLEVREFKGKGSMLLEERIRRYRDMWQASA